MAAGVAFLNTFFLSVLEMQLQEYNSPVITLLNAELELKAEKDNVEIRAQTVEDYQAIIDAKYNIIYDKIESIHNLEPKSSCPNSQL